MYEYICIKHPKRNTKIIMKTENNNFNKKKQAAVVGGIELYG